MYLHIIHFLINLLIRENDSFRLTILYYDTFRDT